MTLWASAAASACSITWCCLAGDFGQLEGVVEVDAGGLELWFGLVLGLDVADGALALPLARQEHDADEGGRLGLRGGGVDRVGAGLEPGVEGAVGGAMAAGLDVDRAFD